MECNGYKNYDTWNVAMWLNGDEGLYRAMVEWHNSNKKGTYDDLVSYLGLEGASTPDGVSFTSSKIDKAALKRVIHDHS